MIPSSILIYDTTIYDAIPKNNLRLGCDYNHIIAYDKSGSTHNCPVTFKENNQPKLVHYFSFLQNQFMKRLQEKHPTADFKYISWNHVAQFELSIVAVSEGGTDPSDVFDLVSTHYSADKKYIHLVTDGNITRFNYDKLNILSKEDRMDIYFLGNCYHNIEFYQKVKQMLGNRCNVYINGEFVSVYDEIVDGQLLISDEDQEEILDYDFNRSSAECLPFNKLLATVATHGNNDKYKAALKKTLTNMIEQSKESSGGYAMSDSSTIKQIREIIGKCKGSTLKTCENVISFIMLQMDTNRAFDSSALDANIFLKNLDKNEEFRRLCKKKKGEGEKIDELPLEDWDKNKQKTSNCILQKLKIIQPIISKDIPGPYLLEGVLNDTKIHESIQSVLNKKLQKIRRFSWYILNYVTRENFFKSIDVKLIPHNVNGFFGSSNNNNEIDDSQYSSLCDINDVSYVLLHKQAALEENDVKTMLNINFMWACSFFFSKKPNMKQTPTWKKFEIVYVYLFLLQEYFKAKNVRKTFVEDVAYTLETLADQKESACKMPHFPVYYSLDLFKKILTESKFLEPKTSPFAALVIRKRLGLNSAIHIDNMILFVACLQWWNTGKCPEQFKQHRFLNEQTFETIMNFPPPAKKTPTQEIFRALLQLFIKSVSSNSQYLFINELLAEQEFYFNHVPINFIKFVILSLNYQKLPLHVHKNIDLNLILAYRENEKYKVDFNALLFKSPLFEKSEDYVCWSTLRPQSILDNDQDWSSSCKNLRQDLEHKDRLKICDNLHLSLYKNYLKCYRNQQKTVSKKDLFNYLVKKYPLKTFQPNILNDIKSVVNTYSKIIKNQYKNRADLVKQVIDKTWNLTDRQNIEKECKNPKCFHYKIDIKDYTWMTWDYVNNLDPSIKCLIVGGIIFWLVACVCHKIDLGDDASRHRFPKSCTEKVIIIRERTC